MSETSRLAALLQRLRPQLDAVRHDGILWRKFAFAGVAHAPEWFRRYSPPVFGTLFYLALPSVRRSVTRNQARIFGVPVDSLVARRAAHRVFVEFSHCLADGLESSARPDRPFQRFDVRLEHLYGCLAQGRGAIMLTAHTGSWELAGRMLATHRNVKTTMVMSPEANAGVRAFADHLRRVGGVDIVYASGRDPATALTLLSRLRANGVIAMQLDRIPASERTLDVRFLGARWRVPEGPFRLAQASGAPILPVFLHRSNYRAYSFAFENPVDVPRSRNGGNEAAHAAQQVVDRFESFVRQHPSQWFHFAPMEDESP